MPTTISERDPAVKAVPAREHRFRPGREYTVGVEEELLLVERETGEPAPQVEQVLRGAPDERIKPELMRCQIELATSPQRDARAVLDELAELREKAGRSAARAGARLVGCGTHPFAEAERQPITARARYRELLAALRYPLRRELCFGMHVHVAVSGADKAIRLIEALLPELPLLVALSASSPFWRGEATGLRSTRTVILQGLPRSGIPPAFASYDGFAETLDRLVAAGAIADHSFLWWDVRPHPRFGTVELRCLDTQPDAVDAAALAGLVQALVRHHGRRYDAGERFGDENRLLVGENRWLAARHGLAAPLIAGDGPAVPARELVAALCDRLAGDADAVGAGWALERVRGIAADGSSADRQLRLHRTGALLPQIIAGLADETALPGPDAPRAAS